MTRTALLLVTALLAAGPSVAPVHTQAQAGDEARLLRFPAIHGSQVVFTYAGDLYTVPVAGGVARRLTSDVGFEMFARFSPDGKSIAFTAQYDGNTEVYLMPADGGVPKRLTYTATLGRDDVSDRMGPNNIVIGWKNAAQILFRSRRTEWNDFRGQLYLVSMTGVTGSRDKLPRGLESFVSKVRMRTSLPLCVGFGISNPTQARRVAKVADGVIVGSRLIQLLEEKDAPSKVRTFVRSLKEALSYHVKNNTRR